MSENNPTPPAGGGGSGSQPPGPDPIFVSFIYDFDKTDLGLGGDGGGRPGTIGGPLSQKEPKYKVFTYPYVPMPAPNIKNT